MELDPLLRRELCNGSPGIAAASYAMANIRDLVDAGRAQQVEQNARLTQIRERSIAILEEAHRRIAQTNTYLTMASSTRLQAGTRGRRASD